MLPSICKKRTGHDRSVERRKSQGTNLLERAKPRCSVVVLSWHCRSIRRGGTAALRPPQPSPSNHPTTLQSPNITHRYPQPSLTPKNDYAWQIDKCAWKRGIVKGRRKQVVLWPAKVWRPDPGPALQHNTRDPETSSSLSPWDETRSLSYRWLTIVKDQQWWLREKEMPWRPVRAHHFLLQTCNNFRHNQLITICSMALY